jgi:hypothetical protein
MEIKAAEDSPGSGFPDLGMENLVCLVVSFKKKNSTFIGKEKSRS